MGGLTGALVGMGLQEDDAHRFVSHVGAGRTLLVVQCDSPADVPKARAALERAGAEAISTSDENHAAVAAIASS